MTNHARAERLALCATLTEIGPTAPTLCEGWDTRDLAAHLVIREGRPDAQAGQLIPALAGYTKTVQDNAGSRPYADLLATLRSGPPAWSPARIGKVDELTNTAEFFVHHEDVLRAQEAWTPRPIPDDLQRSLWGVCTTMGRLAMRKAPVGVELVAPGYGRAVVRKGQPLVQVEGPPGEVLLFLFGRRPAAQVHLQGPAEAVAQL